MRLLWLIIIHGNRLGLPRNPPGKRAASLALRHDDLNGMENFTGVLVGPKNRGMILPPKMDGENRWVPNPMNKMG